MASLLQKLPAILVLCALLAIFLSLRKDANKPAIRLWIVAWGFILLHFLAQVWESDPGWPGRLFSTLDLGGLELAGVVFIASMAQALVEPPWSRRTFLLIVGVPVGLTAVLSGAAFNQYWMYVACLATIFVAAPIVLLVRSGSALCSKLLAAVLLGVGLWAIYGAIHHSYDNGDLAMLREAGVDVVWVPSEAEVYPPGFQTYVTVEEVTQPLEGAASSRARRGHEPGRSSARWRRRQDLRRAASGLALGPAHQGVQNA